MSVENRPSDAITEDFLILGLPVVEFGFELAGGGYGAYFGLGIPDSVEFQKALQFAQLRNAQSGTSKLVRELVRQFDASLQVTTFRHNGQNLQLMFASAALADVASATVGVTDDTFYLTDDDQVFHDLAHGRVVEPLTSLDPAPIVDEDVGIGDGTLGDASGDYSLDFKPLLVADVTSVTVAGVAYTPIAVGAAAAGLEVEVVVGASATSGDLQFFNAGVAVNVTGQILASYQPSHSLSEGTDFVVDYINGRVRILSHDQAADPLKNYQPLDADYDYLEADHELIQPGTQFVFPGRARIRQLTDVGMNLVWPIPKAQVRLTDDAFVFNRDDFTTTPVIINLLEDDTDPTKPYGDLKIYREGTF